MENPAKYQKIDAIILAGGLGTRLRPLVRDQPKVVAPVNGRPFIQILLEFLNQSLQIRRVVVATGYMAEQVVEVCSRHEYDFDLIYSFERELLGTGGGIRKALTFTNSRTVLTLNGDSYVEFDIPSLLAFHERKKASFTMILRSVEDASRFGRVLVDSQARLINFEEKKNESSPGLINAGVYLFDRRIFSNIKLGHKISFERDIMPHMLKDEAFGYICEGKFIDIGLPEDYLKSGDYLKEI